MKVREYLLEDAANPAGGLWIKCKDDRDCVFCVHCTDIYWDYTNLIYAIRCEEGHDPWNRPCRYFKEEGENR